MRDAEHDLSQHESTVEITPLPVEEELPEAQKLSTVTVHQNASQMGRANRSDTRRYLLRNSVLLAVHPLQVKV